MPHPSAFISIGFGENAFAPVAITRISYSSKYSFSIFFTKTRLLALSIDKTSECSLTSILNHAKNFSGFVTIKSSLSEMTPPIWYGRPQFA